jgi:hypothetical protein
MEYADTTPLDLAAALRRTLDRRPRFRAVPSDGARVAAERIVPMLRR